MLTPFAPLRYLPASLTRTHMLPYAALQGSSEVTAAALEALLEAAAEDGRGVVAGRCVWGGQWWGDCNNWEERTSERASGHTLLLAWVL